MKRSILLSLMFIGGILGVLGFTAAQWTDHEQVNAELTAGTLDLTVGNGTTFASALYTCTLTLDEETGGQACLFSAKNEGSVPGEIWMTFASTQKSCVDNAIPAGEFCNDETELEADNVFVDAETNGTNHGFWAVPWIDFEGAGCQAIGSDPDFGSWNPTAVPSSDIPVPMVVDPNEVVAFKFIFRLAGETGLDSPMPSGSQGDSITLTFHLTMVEAGAGNQAASAPCVTVDPT